MSGLTSTGYSLIDSATHPLRSGLGLICRMSLIANLLADPLAQPDQEV